MRLRHERNAKVSIRRRTGGIGLGVTLVGALTAAGAGAAPTGNTGVDDTSDQSESALAPVDPEDWVHQEDTTWDDYEPVPDIPDGWVDGSISGSEREFKAAVVLLDFTDQPMLITQEPGSHPFGSPAEDFEPIAGEDAAGWWADYLNTPNEYNEGHTITEYWMENSNGRYSVDVDAFGTYTLPGKLHEYGLAGHAPVTGPDSVCPAGDDCTKDLRDDGFELWYGDQGADIHEEYDILFWVTAGHDESGAWQEFGDMQFSDREDVPDELGPPGAEEGPVYNDAGNEIANWAPTRYVEWTSWRAAATHWPNAGGDGPLPNSTQSESSGQSTFQHEMSHLLGIADNYNNPFDDPPVRTYSGHWDMLSRGTFNGPGGTHARWQVPNEGGSAMGSHFTLRNKMELDLIGDDQVVRMTRSQLAEQGVATARVQARSVNRAEQLMGFNIAMDGDGDRSDCAEDGHVGEDAHLCDGGGYDNYTVEVVDQMGMDSFTPSSGVHIAKTKDEDDAPFVWTVDAQPEDIGLVDFVRPDGEEVMVSPGDPRQVNDAMFRAGTGSGSEYEHVDEANGLHFYVLDRHTADNGVLNYDVAVRSTEASGNVERGVALDDEDATVEPVDDGESVQLSVPLTNTGAAGDGVFGSDVYRITTEVEGEDWAVTQPHDVVAAEAGGTIDVPVHLTRDDGGPATVTLTAVSESDPQASKTIEFEVYDLAMQYSSDLLQELIDDDTVNRSLGAQMSVHLNTAHRMAELDNVAQAERALDRLVAVAERVDDDEAKAALLEAAGILRQT